MAAWLRRLATAVAPPGSAALPHGVARPGDARNTDPAPRDAASADEPAGGPPEHWLALVRERAPHFLAELERPVPARPPATPARRGGLAAGWLDRLIRSGKRVLRRVLSSVGSGGAGERPGAAPDGADGPAGQRSDVPAWRDGTTASEPGWPREPEPRADRPGSRSAREFTGSTRPVGGDRGLPRWPLELVRRLIGAGTTPAGGSGRERRPSGGPGATARDAAATLARGSDTDPSDTDGTGSTAGTHPADTADVTGGRRIASGAGTLPGGGNLGGRPAGTGRTGVDRAANGHGGPGRNGHGAGRGRAGEVPNQDLPRRSAARGDREATWGATPDRRTPGGRPAPGHAADTQAGYVPAGRSWTGDSWIGWNGGTGARAGQPAGMPWMDGTGAAGVAVEWEDAPSDRWPELPDDEALWAAPAPPFRDDHVRRLEREQRGW